MTERPNAMLGLLLALALAVLSAVALALATLADCNVGGLGMRLMASLSACVLFFHHVRSVPVGGVVLAAVALASLTALGRELWRALKEQRQLRRLPLLPATHELSVALGEVRATRVFLLPTSRPVAFCFGLLRPRIMFSTCLLERLGDDEREAALWHEVAHARRREPLRSLLARLATKALFWLPAVGDLLDRYLLARELAADRFALEKTSRRALAGALCSVMDDPAPAGAVGLADLTSARVERLLDPTAPLPRVFQPHRLLTTIGGVALLLLLVAIPAQVNVQRFDRVHHVVAGVAVAVGNLFS